MPGKVCDHTSVGMIVRRGDEILFIERKRFPFGWAAVAGHVDSDAEYRDETYEVAARRELMEEVGLRAKSLKLVLDERKGNQCRREGGTWHHWKVYEVEAEGEVQTAEDEVRRYRWLGATEIEELAGRTKRYLEGETTEEEWKKSPGLEPVWYEFLRELGVI